MSDKYFGLGIVIFIIIAIISYFVLFFFLIAVLGRFYARRRGKKDNQVQLRLMIKRQQIMHHMITLVIWALIFSRGFYE